MLRRLLPFAALPALALFAVACDSNTDKATAACYDRKGAPRECFAVTETTVGTGAVAAATDSVTVTYKGRVSGAQFDAGTFSFPLQSGEVIEGFYYGIAGGELDGLTVAPMRVGGSRTIVVPAELGYRDREIRNGQGFVVIPKNSTLTFDLTLNRAKKVVK